MSGKALQIDSATGLLLGARQVLSPHFDQRPIATGQRSAEIPELIVVHGISLPPGEFGGPFVEQLFTGNLLPGAHPYFATIAGARVSAHVLIRRDGALIQFVPFHERAWHAGVSSWCGREACNDFSIGIELEGDDTSPYDAVQYDSLVRLINALCGAYPKLSRERVVGHSDIAPGRKTDPGEAFDWPRLRAALLSDPAAT